LKKIGCGNCWNETERRAALQKSQIEMANDPLQYEWQKLCTYYTSCILAEAGESLFDYDNSKFPTVAGLEQVFSGSAKQVEVSGPGIDQRLGRNGSTEPQEFLYGWPTVVVSDKYGKVKVAPLFVVLCDLTIDPDSRIWQMEQKTDPDLNIALLSGNVFDASIAAEIDVAVEGNLSFGNKEELNSQIHTIAEILDLSCKGSFISPLDASFGREQGIYNCALILNSNSNGASRDVLQELQTLVTRTDWKNTAAGLLINSYLCAEDRKTQPNSAPTAGPILLNRTQENATDSSRKNRLTVVTGPPGTGKSQLVVGAVANAWLDKETVLVTSTNNAAVDVAVRRATDLSKALLMRTGNKTARESLPSLVSEALSEIRNETDETSETVARSKLWSSQTERKRLHDLLASVEKSDTGLTDLAHEIEDLSKQIWPTLNISENFNLEIDIAKRVQSICKVIFFRKRRLKKYFAKSNRPISMTLFGIVRQWADTIERFTNIQNSQNIALSELSPSAAFLINAADEAWVSFSQQALFKSVRSYIQAHPAAFAQIGIASGGAGKLVKAIELSMRALRGWASTTLSMSRNFPLKAGLFDLSIIDEASQCNIAYILPIAYRSKRILVVGDPNQLSPIVLVGKRTVDSIAESIGFVPGELNERGLDFDGGSAYKAYEHVTGVENVLLLNEHYRCHPMIARWFNQAFYGSALQIVTDVSTMNPNDRGVSWLDVEGTAFRPLSGRSWRNQEEVDLAAQIVESVADEGLSVAVVTPFAAQASAIQQLVENKIGHEALGGIDFTSGTAHRLQGDERDIVIFSCCVAPGISSATARWVEKERNLINVAVSRARQRLIIIGHPSIGELDCPTLASLREFAKNIGADGGSVGHRADSEAENRLLDAMLTADLSVLAKVNVDGFELDFAIINDKYKLNIEVDGDHHFDAARQQRRQDIVRDQILSRSGWEVLRYPAWQCLLHPSDVVISISDYLKN